jgi:hypothetical protein
MSALRTAVVFMAGCACTTLLTRLTAARQDAGTPPARQLAEQRCAPTPREAVAAMQAANKRRLSDKTKRHGYQVAYGPFLAPFILKPIRLLEIGMESGASVQLWGNLFPNLQQMYGVTYGGRDDSDATTLSFAKRQGLARGNTTHPSDMFTLYHGDQSDTAFLQGLAADLSSTPVDLIIDDGSHVPRHQLKSFVHLFPVLADGGLYIIEDVETSYWDRKGGAHGGAELFGYRIDAGIGSRGSAVERFKQVCRLS